jgi:hypothetical protein
LRLPFEIPPPWCISSSEKLEIECDPKFGGTGCYTNKYPFVKKWSKLCATHLEVRITMTGHYGTSPKVTIQLLRLGGNEFKHLSDIRLCGEDFKVFLFSFSRQTSAMYLTLGLSPKHVL